MTRSARTKIVGSLIALLAIALVFPSALAAPVAPATVSELPTSWAYGGNTSNWVNITNATGNYVATIHSFFGVQVVLNQTNLSANDTLVAVKRTIAFDYQALYCTPTCQNPSGDIYANFTAWQVAVGFVNFTTGTVQTPSGAVPALAVGNESLRVQGNLTERFDTGYRNLLGTWKTGNDYLTVQANASLLIGFNPAFGLLPLSLTGVPSWTSSSVYTAAGSWAVDYAWAKDPIFGTASSDRQSTGGSLTSTGTVTLAGFVGAAVTLADAAPTQSVSLSLNGPFDLRDGVLFLPIVSDVFQSSTTQTWSSYSDAAGPASTTGLNIGAHQAHLGVLASATSYQPMATSSFVSSNGSTAGSMIPTATPAQPSAGAQTLQAQPEGVTYSYTQGSCLTAGSCPGQNGLGPLPNPAKNKVFGAVVVVLAVAVVAALIALGVVGRRRQLPPPPPRTNSTLYPPARSDGSSPPGLAGAAGPRTPPPGNAPSADDPLSNLW